MRKYRQWWKHQQLLPHGQLPENLRTLLENEDPAFIKAMCTYVCQLQKVDYYDYTQTENISYAWLWNLYLHPSPLAKKTLVTLFSRYPYYKFREFVDGYGYWNDRFISGPKLTFIPFVKARNKKGSSIRFIKAIYKRAEEKQDEEIWPVIAYRFDVGQNHYYSQKTRHYMRRRTWRYLRRLGERGSSAYVRMATKVLLYYDNSDSRRKHHQLQGHRWKWINGYTHLWLFNHLLYHNSSRFTYPSSRYWQDRGFDSYPTILPEEREEAFPELWDQHPKQLWVLLTKAKAEPVLQFAGRALRMGNPHYVSQKILHELLHAKHPAQRSFAAGSLLDRMDPNHPDLELLLSFLFSTFPEIRVEAKRFIVKHIDQWRPEQIQRLIHSCNQLLPDYQENASVIKDLLELYQGPLKESIAQLATIDLAKQFLQSPIEPLRNLSAYVLSAIDFDQSPFTGKALLPFLTTTQPDVQEAARKRLEKELHRLKLDGKWLAEYVCKADEASHAFIRNLFQQNRLWLLPLLPQLLSGLWRYLLQKGGSEQVEDFIIDHLFGDLFFGELSETPLSKILFLLEHENSKVQAFAARLMDQTKLDPWELSFGQLLSMAHHRVAVVRAEARRMMMEVKERITSDWMVNLIETDWTDTREWMFTYIRNLPASSVTPDLIYGLLDTARSDVQALSQELVKKYESTLDLKELMLRGSEHPDLNVQEYVLILADEIEWDPETLEKMELFFRTVLLRVHQGRKAKKKALSLLLRLSEQHVAYAKICVPILADIARNQGVKDFETILTALTRIQIRFPECATPIEIG